MVNSLLPHHDPEVCTSVIAESQAYTGFLFCHCVKGCQLPEDSCEFLSLLSPSRIHCPEVINENNNEKIALHTSGGIYRIQCIYGVFHMVYHVCVLSELVVVW